MKFKNYFMGFVLMLLAVTTAFSQEKTISGTVTSAADGLPLPGVNVLVIGTTRGVQTDFDGNYTIKASQGEVLQFSFIGFSNVRITIGSSSTYDIKMQEDVAALDEVIVVAYGTTTNPFL